MAHSYRGGWQLVEGVMECLKKFHPDMQLDDNDTTRFANEGGNLFDQEFNCPLRKGSSLTWKGKFNKKFSLAENTYCMMNFMKMLVSIVRRMMEVRLVKRKRVKKMMTLLKRTKDMKKKKRCNNAMVCSEQVHQAQRVNSASAADSYKEFLHVFDVCTIAMDGNKRGTDKRNIPVLITQIIPYTSTATKISTYRYKCLTKVGYLESLKTEVFWNTSPD